MGRIAVKFAAGLADADGAVLLACGSRSQDKADAFGEANGAERCYGSYEALVADPDIDAVYVATPHPMHAEMVILAMNAGKAVLVEKPFALNATQAREMIAAAKQNDVFLMEAMWTRFLPHTRKLKQLVDSGAVGPVRMMQADFGFGAPLDPTSRLFDLALGGGALLDVGIYPISMAYHLLGPPTEATGLAHLGETGVDEQTGVVMRHAGGEISLLSTSCRANTTKHLIIMGEEGQIRIAEPWWAPNSKIKLFKGRDKKVIRIRHEGNGFNYQAEEVARCIAAGEKESPTMPLDESLAIMETLDALRQSWGLKYPGDA